VLDGFFLGIYRVVGFASFILGLMGLTQIEKNPNIYNPTIAFHWFSMLFPLTQIVYDYQTRFSIKRKEKFFVLALKAAIVGLYYYIILRAVEDF
jgi:hypothetical protein